MTGTHNKVRGTTVAIDGRGVLITGPSGAGKSDLALRLIDRGARLVSDDYTEVQLDGTGLVASPPATIAGKIEIRGVGIVEMDYVIGVRLALVIDLSGEVARMPKADEGVTVEEIALPVLRLSAVEASAPIKVEMALARLGG